VVRLHMCERNGWGSKNLKTEHGDSVSNNDRRLWVWVDGMEVVGGLHIHQHKAGGRGLGQKLEIEHLWLGFQCAV
jgi:hypothetical protein